MSVCPSPKGKGIVLSSFLFYGVVEFPRWFSLFQRKNRSLPFRGDGRGVRT